MKSMKPDATGSAIPARSWLFVPANNERRVEKAFASAADAIILDLEDAVSQAKKAEARAAAAEALGRSDRPGRVYVRINALDTVHALDDLEAIVAAGPNGIVLPMARSAQDVATLDWLLTQFERRAGIGASPTRIVALVETGKGVANATDIATSSPRIAALAFGAGDFTADLNLRWSRDELELLPHRSNIVIASRAAGIAPPLDAVWVEMADQEGMAASAARSRDHGFQGKMCIHPDQVALVNAAYTPSPEALARARQIIAAFDAAEQGGTGAIQIDGKMIDQPIVAAARAVIAEHGSRNPLPHGDMK
jgi:citrate lyase subunit beta/citryl-CoA lyase